MRTNSGAGEAKNNNHDPTLRDRDGKGPAQQSASLDRNDDEPAKAPADHRGSRK